jgi:NADH-quinone oxidoreductase subunit N
MISLGYYLRIIAAMWMREAPEGSALPARRTAPALAGGSSELDAAEAAEVESALAARRSGRAGWEVEALAVLCGAATVVLGILPSPLFDLARDAGHSISGLF